jgi:hypothetical protein
MKRHSKIEIIDPVDPYYTIFQHLLERIEDLEDRTFPRGKKEGTTRAQQMLLLKHTGLLDAIDSLGITKKQKANFLSRLLNASADNIEGDLTTINTPKYPLINKENYQFLLQTFEQTGLTKQKKDAEIILRNLERKG